MDGEDKLFHSQQGIREEHLVLYLIKCRGHKMPKVGKKHFEYTKSGKKAAAAESARTGTPVRRYKKGGVVTVKKKKKRS